MIVVSVPLVIEPLSGLKETVAGPELWSFEIEPPSTPRKEVVPANGPVCWMFNVICALAMEVSPLQSPGSLQDAFSSPKFAPLGVSTVAELGVYVIMRLLIVSMLPLMEQPERPLQFQVAVVSKLTVTAEAVIEAAANANAKSAVLIIYLFSDVQKPRPRTVASTRSCIGLCFEFTGVFANWLTKNNL